MTERKKRRIIVKKYIMEMYDNTARLAQWKRRQHVIWFSPTHTREFGHEHWISDVNVRGTECIRERERFLGVLFWISEYKVLRSRCCSAAVWWWCAVCWACVGAPNTVQQRRGYEKGRQKGECWIFELRVTSTKRQHKHSMKHWNIVDLLLLCVLAPN